MPTIFIGDLPDDARQRDIEDFFRKYGKIEQIRLRNRFGFVDFRSQRDAEDAVRDLDGERMCGERVRLEISDGRRSGRRGSRDRGGSRDRYDHYINISHQLNLSRRRRYSRSRSRSRGRGGGGGGGRSKPHRTKFTLEIDNLSSRIK